MEQIEEGIRGVGEGMTNTEMYVYQKIAQHPGIRHSAVLGSDRSGQTRRREALLLLMAQGHIVRSQKRPWRYTLKTQETLCR